MKQTLILAELADAITTIGKTQQSALELLEQYQEQQADHAQRVEAGEDINEEGWHNDVAYAWRLMLQNSAHSAVIYFTSEPTYAAVKAFARAAGMPVNTVQVEQRDG